MPIIPKNQLYQWFRTKMKPTQEQFWGLFDSYFHKEELIPINKIQDIDTFLQQITPIDSFNSHLNDENAHSSYLAKKNASNLSPEEIISWKTALEVGDIPDNVALVDLGVSPEVFNKAQIYAMTMMVADFVNGGKIRADKIEALGLTDLVEADENTLASFVANSSSYEYQKNDFIAIPDVSGNYSLFMFKGGLKDAIGNYLPTGLSNITIPMVEGLQMALNGKLDKPASSGDFYLSKTIIDGIPYYQYKVINLQAGQIPRSFGSYIGASALFEDNGKIGLGTNVPTEKLHLTGRGRMSAIVLEENTESLPNQITKITDRFYGSNSSGIKRPFMYKDYDDTFDLFNNFSASQSLALSQLLNGGSGSTGAMSVNLISPPIVQNQYNSVEYVMLQGANLNLSAISRKIEILASDKVTVMAVIPDNQIQIYDNGLSLVFYYNFYQFAEGQYFIKITSGSKVYITTLDLTIVPTVTDINIAGITWEKLYDSGVTPPSSDFAVGGNVIATSSTPQTNLPTTSFKSSELFAQGDDFYIELKIDLLDRVNGGTGYMPSYVGLGYSNTANNLVALSQTWFEYSWASGANFYLAQNNGNGIIYDGPARSFTVVFIKTGNLFRTIIGSSNVSKTLSNNSGYSLFMQLVGRPAPTQLSFQIIKAFKIN